MHAASRSLLAATTLLLALCAGTCTASGFETKKLKALLSAAETKGGNDSEWTVNWSLDGKWLKSDPKRLLELTTDSDYSKSNVDKSHFSPPTAKISGRRTIGESPERAFQLSISISRRSGLT